MSVKTTSKQLAKELGCDERTMARWRDRPDAPKSDDVAQWRAYMDANGLGRDTSKTKTQLQEAKLAEEIALLKIKRAQAEGSTVGVEEMAAYVAAFSARLDQLLTQKIEVELPPRVQGKDIVEIRREARAIHDEIRETYNSRLAEWKPAT
jgi:hypothetical protein